MLAKVSVSTKDLGAYFKEDLKGETYMYFYSSEYYLENVCVFLLSLNILLPFSSSRAISYMNVCFILSLEQPHRVSSIRLVEWLNCDSKILGLFSRFKRK